ncbi:hypothetical protein BWR59_16015 [Pseudomonas sp. Bc-h]|uniref:nucleotidyltransferase domain-containing protein n=1 Tax=Pseudomonas sp. Bc-h TaxID=1943632 RepID=UPI0009D9899F|nr:nucleotidyltransferase domain-containing protein [Pseudomonas sp. Bc-h]OQR31015.1 hypothetical protein BWR59_16015 [Pseudomonas sp. Bc-h]
MHIYAFGSVCRGEIDQGSDVDMLACVSDDACPIDGQQYSIYTYDKLRELWLSGNPFVWHLHLESKLVFSSDGRDFLAELGAPQKYINIESDLEKFTELFNSSSIALSNSLDNAIFNISCVFLAVRNAAMCYSLHVGQPEFSRRSALNITPALEIPHEIYSTLIRARLLSSRGHGTLISKTEILAVIDQIKTIHSWLDCLEKSQNEK